MGFLGGVMHDVVMTHPEGSCRGHAPRRHVRTCPRGHVGVGVRVRVRVRVRFRDR